MYEIKFLPIIVAALIPTIMGFIYYNPAVMGKAWMNSMGKTEKELQEGFNFPVVMLISLVLAFFLSFFLDTTIELSHKTVENGELIFGSTHTFGHGAFHGIFIALMTGIPVLVTNGMFERKSAKNLLINTLYWVVTISLMCGLLDAWNKAPF